MLRQISLRKKILLTFAFFFLISLIVTGVGYYQYFLINKKLHLVENKDTLLNMILEARRYEKNYFITYNRKHLQSALNYVEKSRQNLEHLIEHYGSYAQARNLKGQLENLKAYRETLAGLYTLVDGIHAPPDLQQKEQDRFQHLQDKVRSLGRGVTEALEGGLQQERLTIKRLVQRSRWYLSIFLGIILFFACMTFLFLLLNIDRPLKIIEKAIYKIANGDYRNIPEIRTGDEFERLVDSLNAMLNELGRRSEQLVQNEKMAALGTLTSGVAHELNNPLNNISTSLQIILEELDDGDLTYQRELLHESEGEVVRSQEIVKALLEFSRETEFTRSRENFRTLVENTIKLIQGEVPKDVSISVDVPDSIEADVDARRIQQVLLNLCINAIQAMENHGGRLTVRAFQSEDGKGFFFEVADTGQGIDESTLSKIFDPFYSTKDIGKGSGLGLSVSKGIIENHGGWISVTSRPGVGTTFTIYLPFVFDRQRQPD